MCLDNLDDINNNSSESYFNKNKEDKKLLSKTDSNIVNIGVYTIQNSLKNQEDGPQIQLYTGSPFSEDGEYPVILHSNEIKMKKKEYKLLNLDSKATKFRDNYIKPLCLPLCLFLEIFCLEIEELTGTNPFEPWIHDVILDKKPFCVVPLSEYITQSHQLTALKQVAGDSRSLGFIKVKNGVIHSLKVEPGYYRTHNNNCVVTYIDLNKQSEDLDSSLDDKTNTGGTGYLTKRLKIQCLTENKYREKMKSVIKTLDPNGVHSSVYEHVM